MENNQLTEGARHYLTQRLPNSTSLYSHDLSGCAEMILPYYCSLSARPKHQQDHDLSLLPSAKQILEVIMVADMLFLY